MRPATPSKIKRELKKHSSTVQIHNNVTLLQRKTWNALLWKAYDDLPAKDIHDISIQQLMDLIGYDSENYPYLQEATLAMMHCIVEWNILGKDGADVWGAAVLLASVQIENGICSYGFAPHLRQKLYNPEMFARIDLDLQKQFRSRYALALWELCTDYLGAKREYGDTPWIALDDFRRLMGVEEGQYGLYKLFSQRVLAPALTEINRVSDFRVTVESQRRGLKIIALKLKMVRVDRLPAPAPAPTPTPDLPDEGTFPAAVVALRDVGFSLADATAICRKGFGFVEAAVRPAVSPADPEAAFLRYVREKLDLLTRQQAAGPVTNAPGFLRQALRHNYANPAFAADEQARVAATAREATRTRAAQHAEVKAHLEQVRLRLDTAIGAMLTTLADTQPHVVEAAVSATLAATPFLRYLCSGDGPPLVLYRNNLSLRSVVNTQLAPHMSEQVAAITAQYAPELAALAAQLAALEADAPTGA